jgi:type IV pilus assembly protein PilM
MKRDMDLLRKLPGVLTDPPPAYAFELSEAGIAMARAGKTPELRFFPLPPGTLSVSPLRDNVLLPDELLLAVRDLAPRNGKRRTAALILPDYSVRVSVLDFDDFPSDSKEQLSLLRFRIKKSVPYDVESAALSYFVQPGSGHGKKLDVVVAVVPLEIVARYEAPFRAAGFNPGLVTTSTLSVLRLIRDPELSALAKLSGRVLTIAVTHQNKLRLIRCVELPGPSLDDIAGDLLPTFVFIEDSLKVRPAKLRLCGFGEGQEEARTYFGKQLNVEVETLNSPLSALGPHNAGLLGYLAS